MHKHLDDADMDATVVKVLSRLPVIAPSRGFADRVMARVNLPQPGPVVLYRRARAWAAQPRHALALAGGYAVSAVVAIMIVVPWLLARLPQIGFAGQWAIARASGAAREALLTVAGWTVSSGAADLFRSLQLSGGRLWLAIAALTIGYAGCALGLHHLLRAPRGKDVPVQLPL
jgi:hypothetical protein